MGKPVAIELRSPAFQLLPNVDRIPTKVHFHKDNDLSTAAAALGALVFRLRRRTGY